MSELYEILKSSVDNTGLPVMSSSQFIDVTQKFGKEEFRKVLADFITKEKPPYPLKEFTAADNFKSYDELKTRLDIVLSGKTVVGNVAETIDEVEKSDTKETKTESAESTDDTLSYFEKQRNA